MSLIKYNPFVTKHPLNSFFNGDISDFIGSDFVNSQPSVNVIESDKEFKIEVAAPGLDKSDFDVKVEKDQLIISVEKEKEEVKENEKYTRREFAYSSFVRSFNLGDQINTEGINATYEEGILNILLPKKEEAIEVKRNIEIS